MSSEFTRVVLVIAILFGLSGAVAAETNLTPLQKLGKEIFFDTNLSSPPGQSCASCHDSKKAFTDPLVDTPVSLGAVVGRLGARNTPSAAYAAFSPYFHFDEEEGLFVGGQFLDGRSANLQEQAKGPFLNPDEMNNTDAQSVIDKIQNSEYGHLFKKVFGSLAFDDVDDAYQNVAEAIAAFENTAVFSQFTSKYDYFLKGQVCLSKQELQGLALFEDESKGNCAACHVSHNEDDGAPLFTDFTYDNLGVPANPWLLDRKGHDFIDLGLGAVVGDSAENGKFKVPSLRNVAVTGPYMHNGVFTTLREVVDFYNTRDVDSRWPVPEVPENVNHDELGDLNLSDSEVDAIVVFLQTLTDGYEPKPGVRIRTRLAGSKRHGTRFSTSCGY